MTIRDSLPEKIVEGALAMLPVVGGLLQPWAEDVVRTIRQEHDRSASTALRAAEAVAGQTREELGREIVDDPRLVPLVTRLLYFAGMTGYDRTLVAMGAALGEAVADRSKIDEAELTISGMAALGRPHFLVLEALSRVEVPEGKTRNVTHAMPENIPTDDSLGADLVERCLRNLAEAGLATTENSFFGGKSAYTLTDLGSSVLVTIDLLTPGVT